MIHFGIYTYALFHVVVLIGPTLITLFHPNAVTKSKDVTTAILISVGIVSPLFVFWDILATFATHWSFNPEYYIGPLFINLPLEEVFFFVSVPLACLFSWAELRRFTTWSDFKQRLFTFTK